MALNSSTAAADSDASAEVARRAKALAGILAKELVAEIKTRTESDRSLGFIGNLQAVRFLFEAQRVEGRCLRKRGNIFHEQLGLGTLAFGFWLWSLTFDI